MFPTMGISHWHWEKVLGIYLGGRLLGQKPFHHPKKGKESQEDKEGTWTKQGEGHQQF